MLDNNILWSTERVVERIRLYGALVLGSLSACSGEAPVYGDHFHDHRALGENPARFGSRAEKLGRLCSL
jgi:hypothetical protein